MLIAAAMLVRSHVFREMSNTSVVSTDCPSPITVLVPEELSVSVPELAEMWMPLPPGQLAVAAVVDPVIAGLGTA